MLGITDAKKFIGQKCSISFVDRAGAELSMVSKVHDVTFVPLYGGYLITDMDDIRLDKVTCVSLFIDTASAESEPLLKTA